MINSTAKHAKFRHAISVALILGLSTATLPVRAQAPQQSQASRLLISVTPHTIPAEIHGTARLLIHDMPSMQGGTTRASTLLFVPNGTPPAGGWPVIA